MAYKFNVFTGQFDLVNPSTSGGGGDVFGPASSVDGDIVIFDGITGKTIKDSGISLDSLTSYSETFNNTIDWTGPFGGSYTIQIPFSMHGKENPIIQIFELTGLDYIEVTTGVRVDASYNITLTVNDTPDLRFDGKFVIS